MRPAPTRSGFAALLQRLLGRLQPGRISAADGVATSSKVAAHAPYATRFGDDAEVASWYDGATPQVSIVIVSRDEPALTKRCVDEVWRHTSGYRYEIVLLDNGSAGESFVGLLDIGGPCRLMRLNRSRSPGEANNIGAERAHAPIIVFIGRDMLVTEGWLAPLIETLESAPKAGIVGPEIIDLQGRPKDVRRFIDAAGEPRASATRDAPSSGNTAEPLVVDYVPASCLALRRSLFEDIGGFDFLFEGGLYEEIDLCLKLRSIDACAYCCPRSKVVQIGDPPPQATPTIASDAHRQNFIERWGPWLDARDGKGLPPHPSPLTFAPRGGKADHQYTERREVVFATPHDLATGGGERYLLSAAAALTKSCKVLVASEETYSGFRLRGLERQLDLDLSDVELMRQSEIHRLERLEHFFVLGNAIVPPIAGMAARNAYICQFPAPLRPDDLASRWRNFETFERIIVYSRFVEEHVARRLQVMRLAPIPIEIVHPPVGLLAPERSIKRFEPPFKIVLIGRFFAGHNKRHDVAIKAVRKLLERGIKAELHLVGSVPHRLQDSTRLERLRQEAAGLPVTFHINAPRSLVERLIGDATLYWHAAGFGVDPETHPEHCEHFGISILEAMSGGCVPLVCNNGGPREFIAEGESGFFYATLEELVDKSERILRDPALFARISEAARAEAARFSQAAFAARWQELVG